MSGRRTGHPNSHTVRRLKRQLAARDGACCFYCGQDFAALAGATLDHLVPHSVLPTWNKANLVLACRPCNEAKADRLPQSILRPDRRYGPGLTCPSPVRHRVRLVTVRAMAAWPLRTVRTVRGRTVRPLTAIAGRVRSAVETRCRRTSADVQLVRCARCPTACLVSELNGQPTRWLITRPPVRTAYCWRCVSAIAGELLTSAQT